MDTNNETNRPDVTNEGEPVLEEGDATLIREQRDRYRFAGRFVEPSYQVLDCACGTGYGSEYLSQLSEDVIAMDSSTDAIRFCRSRYASSGIRFEVGNTESLPLEDKSIDVYVSFETIERVPSPEKLLSEAARILKPSGTLLVSAPNRVFSGLKTGQTPANPVHLREWSLKEFDALLTKLFPRVHYFAQRVKSPNKFHAKYLRSKLKRLFGMTDIIPIPGNPKTFDELETGVLWNPMVFVAHCRKH